MLVDEKERQKQLALGGDQVGLGLGRHDVAERVLDPSAQIEGELQQLVSVARAHLPNLIFSSPSSILAPNVWRLANTRGRLMSRL